MVQLDLFLSLCRCAFIIISIWYVKKIKACKNKAFDNSRHMLEKRQELLPQQNITFQLPTEESISLKLNSPDQGNASGTVTTTTTNNNNKVPNITLVPA